MRTTSDETPTTTTAQDAIPLALNEFGDTSGVLDIHEPTLIISTQLGCEVGLALVVFFGLAAVFVADFADMLNIYYRRRVEAKATEDITRGMSTTIIERGSDCRTRHNRRGVIIWAACAVQRSKETNPHKCYSLGLTNTILDDLQGGRWTGERTC